MDACGPMVSVLPTVVGCVWDWSLFGILFWLMWLGPFLAGVVCGSVAEVHWEWGWFPAVAGPGMSWDGVGIRRGCSMDIIDGGVQFCC